jgi:hypothetical protein
MIKECGQLHVETVVHRLSRTKRLKERETDVVLKKALRKIGWQALWREKKVYIPSNECLFIGEKGMRHYELALHQNMRTEETY